MVEIPPPQDLSMTHEEVEAFLRTFHNIMFGASMMGMDEMCYGGDEKAEKQYQYLCKALGALPKKIVDGYNFNLRLKKALEELDKVNTVMEKISG